MHDLLKEKAQESIQNVYNMFTKGADDLGKPEVYYLNRRSLRKFCSAVAVDAGESLFSGAFKMMGITLFSLATSNLKDEPQYFLLFNGENFTEIENHKIIMRQLQEWYTTSPFIKNFLDATGWVSVFKDPEGILPPRTFSDPSECVSVFREIIEWAKLYELAVNIHEMKKRSPAKDIDFVILRDGVLRFNNMGESHSKILERLFKDLQIPILGVTKRSRLLLHPLVQIWLQKHNILGEKESFIIRLNDEFFEKARWALSRYYDGDMRFGRYHIVRFDPYPGNCNLFIVDVPQYIKNWEEVLNILSGLKDYTSTTVFPVPGYPYPLIEAHRHAKLDEGKTKLIENFLRRSLAPEHYTMLKNLIEINMRRESW